MVKAKCGVAGPAAGEIPGDEREGVVKITLFTTFNHRSMASAPGARGACLFGTLPFAVRRLARPPRRGHSTRRV